MSVGLIKQHEGGGRASGTPKRNYLAADVLIEWVAFMELMRLSTAHEILFSVYAAATNWGDQITSVELP